MRLRTMGYLTAEAVDSVRGNGLLSLAAVSTVGISLLVLSIVVLLALNMGHLAGAVDAQVQVVAYLQPTATSPQENQIVTEIRAVPHVTRVTYVSKAQAISALKSDFGAEGDLLNQFSGAQNPLPDSVNIYVDRTSDVAGVAAAVKRIDGVGNVLDAQGVVDKLTSFTRAVRRLGAFLVACLALATVVVIGNTVRVAVYARRDQIAIMKLVGATNGFIRWPFFIEGAILGLGGAVLCGAVVWWGYSWVQRAVEANLGFLQLIAPTQLLPALVEVLLVAGVLLGAIGSAVSVRRHLDV